MGDAEENNRGFAMIACEDKVPLVNTSVSGRQAAAFQGRARQFTLQLAAYCTGGIIETGTNDIYAGFKTATQLAALNLNIAIGIRRVQGDQAPIGITTLVPRVTTTDGTRTIAGQTPITSGGSINPEAERLAYNAWLRGGAPVNSSTLAPVAIGTSGALLIGAAGHPFSFVHDTAATVESDANGNMSLTGGRWYVSPNPVRDTGTATSGASGNLGDTSKTWTANQHAGYLVRIVSGTGAGQARGIARNDPSLLVIYGTWATIPDATSVYEIYDGATIDGVHPATTRHKQMAGAVDVQKYLS